MEEVNEFQFVIRDAAVKDDLCNYSFEQIAGVGQGDALSAKGSNMVHDDLLDAFSKLRVHLAMLDDSFMHSGVDVKGIKNLDEYHNHELTMLYHVTAIRHKGNDDNATVIIVGSKHISMAGGRIDIVTPKIPLDSLSSYQFSVELNEAVETIRNEVSLYKEGKYSDELIEFKADSPNQMNIMDQLKDNDFDDAKV